MKIKTKISLSVIGTTLVSVLLILGTIFLYTARDIKRDAEGIVIKIIEGEAVKIENKLNLVKLNVDNYINLINSTLNLENVQLSQKNTDDYENSILKTAKGIVYLSPDKNIWFIGNTPATKNLLHISLRDKDGKAIREEKYEVVGTDNEKAEWWQGPVQNGTNWSAPYQWDNWGPGTELISYGKKVEIDGKFIGVAGTEFYFNRLKEQLAKIKIFGSGYITLMTKDLSYLYNPDPKIKTPKDISEETYNLFKKEMSESHKESGIINYEQNGVKKILVFKKLSNGWILGANPVVSEMFVTLNRLNRMILIVMVLVVSIGIVLSLFVAGTISKPVSKMEEKFNDLSQGNLNVKLEISTKDEIGKLSKNFNEFVEKLQMTIKNIMLLTKEVLDASKAINSSMDNLINGDKSEYYHKLQEKIDKGIIQLNISISNVLDNVRNQTASAEESLAALEEIAATSENINKNIGSTNKSFTETLNIANSSEKDMIKMSENMNEIQNSTEETNEEIEKLKILSNNIGSIITAIDSISERTNLLALNAAIEAARAGEAGRGFSVVADEIRKLAEQTNKETGKIEELIRTIQNEVEIVKSGAVEVNEKVGQGLKLSEISRQSMGKIIENNNKNADEIKEITTSVDEQAVASREITTAISTIAESSTEIESLSLETTQISDNVKETILKNQKLLESMEKLVEKLNDDLSFFKLN